MSGSESETRSRPGTTASIVSRQTSAAASGGAPSRVATAAPLASTPGQGIVLEDRGADLLARGGTIYTGPDGQRPHRKAVDPEYMFVGEGDRSLENTSAVAYLFRGPRDAPFPPAKHQRIGEIGWYSRPASGPPGGVPS